MRKTILSGWSLIACLFMASCGGSGDGTTAQGSFTVAGGSEINATNALLVARIANLAVTRSLAFRDLNATVFDLALSQSPTVPSSVNCGGPQDGLLGIATQSPIAFNVTLQSCRASSGVVFNSGIVFIDNFSRVLGGTPVSFNTTANAIQITDSAGISMVTGNISYHRTIFSTTTETQQSETDTGQLDYTAGTQTDQYRNIAVTFDQTTGQLTGSATPSTAVTISRMDITTPRVSISKILVATPGPLTFGTPTTLASSDILQATSANDGSLVVVNYIGTTSFRLRCFDSHGNQVLDVTKNNTDADVIAADTAAAG